MSLSHQHDCLPRGLQDLTSFQKQLLGILPFPLFSILRLKLPHPLPSDPSQDEWMPVYPNVGAKTEEGDPLSQPAPPTDWAMVKERGARVGRTGRPSSGLKLGPEHSCSLSLLWASLHPAPC